MIKKNKMYLLFLIFLLSCNKKSEFGVSFFFSFDEDRVKLFYNDKLMLDTCITTDASTGIAKDLVLKKIDNGILTVIINEKERKAITIDKYICRVYIRLDSSKLKIIKDSVCKKRAYY
jgi:hypothetical protein